MSLYAPKQKPINVGLAPTPPMGPRCLGGIALNFGAAGSVVGFSNIITDDFELEVQNGTIDPIQSVYFDNSANASIVQFTILDTGQTLNFPAKSQGYLPVLCSNSFKYSAVAWVSPGQTVNLLFFNVPIAPYIWSPSGTSVRAMAAGSNNAGNTALTVTPIFSVAAGKHCHIAGLYIGGTGATAAGDVTAQITNIQDTASSGSVTLEFDIFVPVIGTGNVDFRASFDPPLISSNNGLNAPQLSVPAMGAGQTFATAQVYWQED